MSRPSTQAVEQYYFERFKSHYDVPVGEIVFTDKPDVIIRSTPTLGIEIARLYVSSGRNPASEQVQSARRLQVLECAQSKYLASGGKHIVFSVDFHPEYPILDVEVLAQSLAAVAKEAESPWSGRVDPRLLQQLPQIRFLYQNPTEYIDAKWQSAQVHSVPSLSLERLREVVTEKTKKLEAYQPCEIYWLLLIVDFMDPAQDQDLSWPVGERLEKSPFSRILLYKPQFAQIVQVPQ